LSIGIFGEWGSGKSFYMRQLKNKVASLAQSSKDTNKPQHACSFYKDIVQIEFNAWNYVESDLWASLAHNIYQNLCQHDPSNKENDTYWLGILKYGEEKYNEKHQEIKKQKSELTILINKVEDLELERQDQEEILTSYTAKQLYSDVLPDDIKVECEKIYTALGGKETLNSVTQTLKMVESGKKSVLWLRSLNEDKIKNAVNYIGIPLLLVATIFALFYFFKPNSELLNNTYNSIAAFGSSLGFWVKSQWSKISGWLKKLESIKTKIEKYKAQPDEYISKEKQVILTRLDEANSKLETALAAQEELTAKINQAKSKLNKLSPESMLSDHIAQTISDNRYGKYLGLPALLSKDFQTLSDAISKLNNSLEDSEKYQTVEDENRDDDKAHRINRIVLYIDDLDRLPSETVVRVLQAVHLFLASPLFVVVLGVDPRWLFTSIKEHYSDLLIDTTDNCASPEEYLEKIFQIPVWLQKPKPEEVSQLIASVIGEPKGSTTEMSSSESTGELAERYKTTKQATSVQTQTEPTNIKNEPPAYRKEVEPPKNINKALIDEKVINKQIQQAQLTQLAEQHQLKQIEIDFIHELSPILARSPRAIKRYLNIYRLIKSSIPVEKEQSFLLENSSNEMEVAGHKTVAFLLAIVVGWPTIAKEIFNVFKSYDSEVLISVVIEEIKLQLIDAPGLMFSSENKALLAELYLIGSEQLVDQELAAIDAWITIVARYSYHKLHLT